LVFGVNETRKREEGGGRRREREREGENRMKRVERT